MDSSYLFKKLDNKFKINQCGEKDWISLMDRSLPYLSDSFRNKQIGLVFDNTTALQSSYTATFASNHVIRNLIEMEVENSALITHHPLEWTVKGKGEKRVTEFLELSLDLLEEMVERNISLYSLHVPLDATGEFSTAVTLANVIGGKWLQDLDFFDYHGVNVGIVAEIPQSTVQDLGNRLRKEFDHDIAIYPYGNDRISENRIGIVGGGGLRVHVLEFLKRNRVNTFLTGITMNTEYNKAAHEYAKDNGINIIGGTHYSTEKYTLINLANWIQDQFNIHSKFIAEKPEMKDIDT